MDKRFKEIYDEARSAACHVPCSPAEYRSNLREWILELEMEILASAESDPERDE